MCEKLKESESMLCNILIHKHGLAAGFETKLISRICKIFYLLLAGLACSGVPVLSNPKFIHSSQYETPCMPLLYVETVAQNLRLG